VGGGGRQPDMHGIIHIGRVPDQTGGFRAQMASWSSQTVRSGRLHGRDQTVPVLIVYPQILREVERLWRAGTRSASWQAPRHDASPRPIPIDGFPRFGTHLHRPPPAVPVDPVIEISGAVAKPIRPALAELRCVPADSSPRKVTGH